MAAIRRYFDQLAVASLHLAIWTWFQRQKIVAYQEPVAHNRSAYGTPRVAEEEATAVALPGGWTLILLADRLIFLFRARLTKSHKPGVSLLTNQRKRAKRVTGTSPWLRWMALMTRAATRSGDVYIHAGAGRMDLPFLPSTMA